MHVGCKQWPAGAFLQFPYNCISSVHRVCKVLGIERFISVRRSGFIVSKPNVALFFVDTRLFATDHRSHEMPNRALGELWKPTLLSMTFECPLHGSDREAIPNHRRADCIGRSFGFFRLFLCLPIIQPSVQVLCQPDFRSILIGLPTTCRI